MSPVAVQLLPGDVVDRPLIGLDSATYQNSRHAVEAIPLADAALADGRRELALTQQQLVTSQAEVAKLQRRAQEDEADYQKLLAACRGVAGKPPAKPLLLDSHTWLGVLLGAVSGGILVLTR